MPRENFSKNKFLRVKRKESSVEYLLPKSRLILLKTYFFVTVIILNIFYNIEIT